MKKTSLLILGILFSIFTFSQSVVEKIEIFPDPDVPTKELTLNDAVLGYYKGLYPSGIRGLQWIKGTDNYMYFTEGKYVVASAKSNKVLYFFDLNFFKKECSFVKRVPNIAEINNKYLVFNYENKTIILEYDNDEQKEKIVIETPKGAANKSFNMKAKAVAYTLDNNLYLATAKNSKIVIEENEDKNIVTGQAIHRFEFGISKGIFWSPDGKYIAYYQKDETDVADYPLLNINETPGKVNSIKYPMAGQKSEYGKVGVYNLKKGNKGFLGLVKRKLKLNTGGEKDDHYLTNVTWGANEEKIYLAEVNRDQNHMWFNEYNVKSRTKIRTVFEEKQETWMEPENPGFFPTKDENTMLWLSEKDGFMNLYKVNMTNGSWTGLTNFTFPITSFIGITDEGDFAFVQATGKDGREKHIYKVAIATGETTQLTSVGGNHSASFSTTGNYIIDSYSNTTTPRVIQLVEANTLKKTILKM